MLPWATKDNSANGGRAARVPEEDRTLQGGFTVAVPTAPTFLAASTPRSEASCNRRFSG